MKIIGLLLAFFYLIKKESLWECRNRLFVSINLHPLLCGYQLKYVLKRGTEFQMVQFYWGRYIFKSKWSTTACFYSFGSFSWIMTLSQDCSQIHCQDIVLNSNNHFCLPSLFKYFGLFIITWELSGEQDSLHHYLSLSLP